MGAVERRPRSRSVPGERRRPARVLEPNRGLASRDIGANSHHEPRSSLQCRCHEPRNSVRFRQQVARSSASRTASMILRVLRARVIDGEEANLARFVRDEAVPHALRTEGMLSFQPAIRETLTGTELVIVSTWRGFDDLTAAGRDLDAPLSMPALASMVADGHGEHYELVIGEARSMPLREAKLRLTRIPIRQNAEAAYYTAVREWSERL